MMLQQERPDDYVIATGIQHSVRDFINIAAGEIDMKITWEGSGVEEKGYLEDGSCIVLVDPAYFRPTEVETLLGDPSKARNELGWKPEISFGELVSEMMAFDMKAAERDLLISDHGHAVLQYNE